MNTLLFIIRICFSILTCAYAVPHFCFTTLTASLHDCNFAPTYTHHCTKVHLGWDDSQWLCVRGLCPHSDPAVWAHRFAWRIVIAGKKMRRRREHWVGGGKGRMSGLKHLRGNFLTFFQVRFKLLFYTRLNTKMSRQLLRESMYVKYGYMFWACIYNKEYLAFHEFIKSPNDWDYCLGRHIVTTLI